MRAPTALVHNVQYTPDHGYHFDGMALLAAAVIASAFEEILVPDVKCYGHNVKHRSAAIEFINGPEIEPWASLTEYSPTTYRNALKIADSDPEWIHRYLATGKGRPRMRA